MQRTLGIGSYRTAWTCLHKLRRAMVRPNREPLTGAVEVDETMIGGRRKGSPGGRTNRAHRRLPFAPEVAARIERLRDRFLGSGF